jgi:RNA polymerase sigma-70 factor (ECF subfamily)
MISSEAFAEATCSSTRQTAQVRAESDPPVPHQSEALALFDELRSPLLRYLWDFRLPSETAEELVQEAFLKLFEEHRGGRIVQTPRPWLFRVVHRLALKELRRLRVREVPDSSEDAGLEYQEIADSRPTPDEQYFSEEREHRLHKALASLPIRDQQCLNLRVEGLRYREIAGVLDISVTTVSDILRRATTTLRDACYE